MIVELNHRRSCLLVRGFQPATNMFLFYSDAIADMINKLNNTGVLAKTCSNTGGANL